ncbi:MAG TPA: Ig-like domain-containing protein [Longimicrobiales bacterium]|nr:Ig-like domain-containing protein [Longimicrobiales bacterium]
MTAPIVRTQASRGFPATGHLPRRGGWPVPLVAAALAIFSACDSSTDPDPVPGDPVPTRVVLSTDEVLLSFVGVSETVTATVLDQNGDAMPGENVDWASNDDGVATVSGSGVITSAAEGTARITASSGSLSAHLDVDIRTGWTAVAAGSTHSCGLWGHGVAHCWGTNADGRLGVGALDPGASSVPLAVASDVLFQALSSGDAHTCGLTTDGEVMCWGTNRIGQLGNGDDLQRSTPTPLDTGDRFSVLSVGAYHGCALRQADRRAYCWGGGLGPAGSGRDVAVGYVPADTCAIAAPFSARCSLSPRAVQGGLAFNRISAGLSHTCAVADGGLTYCWGWNEGQLGNGEIHGNAPGSIPAGYVEPGAVSGGHFFAEISAGTDHTCGVTLAGEGYCWGGSAYSNTGQLGNGGTGARSLPTVLDAAVAWGTMASARQNSDYNGYACGLDANAAAWCWGSNRKRQLGSVATEACAVSGGIVPCALSPQPVSGDRVFESLSPGLEFTCGVDDDRTAWCWGANAEGQLGDGSTTDRTTPVQVVDPSPPSASSSP